MENKASKVYIPKVHLSKEEIIRTKMFSSVRRHRLPMNHYRQIIDICFGSDYRDSLSENDLYVFVNVYDIIPNGEYKFIETEVYEFRSNESQRLILAVLNGDKSPYSIYSFFEKIFGTDFNQTTLGKLLYLSIGHPNHNSLECIQTIDDELKNQINQKINYRSNDHNGIIQELHDLFEIDTFNDTIIGNPFKCINNLTGLTIYDNHSHFIRAPNWVSQISFTNESVLNITMNIKHGKTIEEFELRFTNPIQQGAVIKVLLGEKSPSDYLKPLFIGSLSLCSTEFDRFICESPGFPDFSCEKRMRVVDDELANILRSTFLGK